MRFLSLFSGIEAASAAWAPLGWTCVGVSEIEPYPCQTLRYRHPNVLNLGDITQITEEQIAALGRIDVLVFGSPCQDLSVAGKRGGLVNADGDLTRSGLFFHALDVIDWAREHCGLRFALWENVPGAFSSNGGADFAIVVGELGGLVATAPPKGWGTEGCAIGTEAMVEWATLDAQWFGVAQRRRRVFAIADFGDWAGRPPILLESQGLRGDSAPRRSPGEVAAGTLAARTEGGGFPGSDESFSGYVQPVGGVQRPVLTCVSNAEGAKPPVFLTCSNLAKTVNNQTPLMSFAAHEVTATLDASYARLQGCSGQDMNHGHSHLVPITGRKVRRLTPRECERLQGFPDDYTLIPVKKVRRERLRSPKKNEDGVSRYVEIDGEVWQLAADGPRYKALGNSMAVPVMGWIGRQIDFAMLFDVSAPPADAEDLFA